jgi:hypothetical protein
MCDPGNVSAVDLRRYAINARDIVIFRARTRHGADAS